MELNKSNVKKIIGIVIIAILAFLGIQNFTSVLKGAAFVLKLFSPLLIGFCLAFIMNVPLKLFEEKVFSFLNKRNFKTWNKLRRPLCLILTFGVFIGAICVLLFLLIPELQRTVAMFIENLPAYLDNLQSLADDVVAFFTGSSQSLDGVHIDWDRLNQSVMNFLNRYSSSMLDTTFQITTSIFSGVFNFIVGLFFSVYMLLQKEKLSRQFQRALYAFFPKPKADRVLSVGQLSGKTFSRFVTGQFTEAVITGSLCFIGMKIMNLPYASAISMLVCVTALIPIFGAFIGVFVGAFLILMVHPLQALWFIIFFIVLQQVEGNLIYPKVVGVSVGLPSIWVLLAVTVGGGLFGILGMLVSVPLCSVVYCLLRETIGRRLKEKGLKIPVQDEQESICRGPQRTGRKK